MIQNYCYYVVVWTYFSNWPLLSVHVAMISLFRSTCKVKEVKGRTINERWLHCYRIQLDFNRYFIYHALYILLKGISEIQELILCKKTTLHNSFLVHSNCVTYGNASINMFHIIHHFLTNNNLQHKTNKKMNNYLVLIVCIVKKNFHNNGSVFFYKKVDIFYEKERQFTIEWNKSSCSSIIVISFL